MKIFLTGATGFIGSHVLNQLMASGEDVVAHRRDDSSIPKIAIDNGINWLTKPMSELTLADFEGVDVLLHLASSSVNYPYGTLTNNIKFNVCDSLDLFEKAGEAGVSCFVAAGSAFEYGKSGEMHHFIPTTARLDPNNNYATSKAMSFLAFRQFAQNKNKKLSYCRIFQVYGEGEAEGRLWPSLKSAAEKNEDLHLTKGEQIRDFVAVEEVAVQLIGECKWIFGQSHHTIRVRHIGAGNPQTIKQFASYWWSIFGGKGKLIFGAIPYRENEIMRYVPKID